MSDIDGLRYTKIALNNGSDEISALGLATLIRDPIATKRGNYYKAARWRWAFVNSIALKATEMKNTSALQAASSKGEQTAVFSDGCFWGLDAVFNYVKGVSKVGSGYVSEDSKGAVDARRMADGSKT
jgi:hypothetical protein